MNSYEGRRDPDGAAIVRVRRPGKPLRPLRPRLDLAKHSPTGFEWGYGGSGPAQLALAILADVLGDDEKAARYHQWFKFMVIAKLPHDRWLLTVDDVHGAVARIEITQGFSRKAEA